MQIMNTEFKAYLERTSEKVSDFILNHDIIEHLKPEHIKQAVLTYLQRPSKRLRPAMLLMSCCLTGGDEKKALGAAAGVELFHTWTLVHDDVIDNDTLRRGEPTVHRLMETAAMDEMNLSPELARDYGRDIAILAGDVQHGWCNTLFIDCALRDGNDPRTILTIIRHLQTYVLNMLVYGEVLDVQFGLQNNDILSIEEDDVVNMLWLKTGILYEFSSMAGAMIGKNTSDINDPVVQSIMKFTGKCGIAFQLQDDILGIVGDEKVLGKPVGSDIREGKKTTILLHALRNASKQQMAKIISVLGDKNASDENILKVKQLLIDLKGVEYTKNLAHEYINQALPYLDDLPENKYKQLLQQWAYFMINRSF
ncbi:hypothetical protein GF337_14800 [candidate division KSB1 bacterium]|nr:hypothetical protein [candidate division KSB1 bacterium]